MHPAEFRVSYRPPPARFTFIQLLQEITKDRKTDQKTEIKKFGLITAGPSKEKLCFQSGLERL